MNVLVAVIMFEIADPFTYFPAAAASAILPRNSICSEECPTSTSKLSGSCRAADSSFRERDCLPSGVRNSHATSPMDLRRRTEFQPALFRPLVRDTTLQAAQERD